MIGVVLLQKILLPNFITAFNYNQLPPCNEAFYGTLYSLHSLALPLIFKLRLRNLMAGQNDNKS